MSLAAKLVRAVKYTAMDASLWFPVKVDHEVAEDVVVSLTTYPARIAIVWKTLETLYRQSVKPGVVVLVLSREEFPNEKLPDSVLKYKAQGLRIIFVEGNNRSYKKLIPTLQEFPDNIIVTADDDVLYPSSWLGDLITAHRERPGHIIGHRGTVISGEGKSVDPYVTWPQANTQSSSSRVFLTGMGGILYPPSSLPIDTTSNMELAMRLAPTADDIWFKAMALFAGTTVSKVSDSLGDFMTVRAAQRTSLREVNVSQHQNDSQFRAVMDYFDLWGNLDSPVK